MTVSSARLIAPDTPRQAVTADGSLRDVPDEMTLEEFEAFPWREGDRWELIYGVPVMSASSRGAHHNLMSKIIALLEVLLADAKPPMLVMTSYDVRIPEAASYVEPDVMVLRDDDEYDAEGVPYEGVPAMVVEVLSPSTASRDVGQKLRAFLAKGIPEYWIVDPDLASVKVLTIRQGAYEAEHPTDDGFVLSPFLKRHMRIRRKGKSFVIEHRPA